MLSVNARMFCFLQLVDGSVILVYTLEYDELAVVETGTTQDVASLAAFLQTEVMFFFSSYLFIYYFFCFLYLLFLCLATKKVAGYYVIPSEILSVRPSVCLSVRQRPHHLCARNSSYSFRPILFKLYRRF